MRYVRSELYGTPSAERMPMTAGEAYAFGEALKVTDGKVTKASGTDKPEFICSMKATGTAGGMLDVTRILPNQTWEAVLTEDGASLAVGDKVNIAADGVDLTATTGGSAQIVQILGTAVGDKIRVMFK